MFYIQSIQKNIITILIKKIKTLLYSTQNYFKLVLKTNLLNSNNKNKI